MLVAEVALLRAVRDRLIGNFPFDEHACDIELDDQVPAIAASEYCAISSAGISPGPRHRTAGGVVDAMLSVRVTIYHRMTQVARDRRRNVFIDLLTGLNVALERVIRLLDFSYAVLDSAKTYLAGTLDSTGEFPEPFRRYSIDPSPRPVFREPYDAANMQGGDPIIAIARSVVFQDARFMNLRPSTLPPPQTGGGLGPIEGDGEVRE